MLSFELFRGENVISRITGSIVFREIVLANIQLEEFFAAKRDSRALIKLQKDIRFQSGTPLRAVCVYVYSKT